MIRGIAQSHSPPPHPPSNLPPNPPLGAMHDPWHCAEPDRGSTSHWPDLIPPTGLGTLGDPRERVTDPRVRDPRERAREGEARDEGEGEGWRER